MVESFCAIDHKLNSLEVQLVKKNCRKKSHKYEAKFGVPDERTENCECNLSGINEQAG